eukprot:CAMPEP_0198435656 /NCGR_PEP_ID=MMETSP1452-20131203/39104_1 /TAXON_ID=1181717 /ORGANISM="Synchroma pusillum, Strain CCMP3072" /LENGTH=37 /DNA_ID= /DNA_START= /DNA_END= /DNA_ORIENTATION=
MVEVHVVVELVVVEELPPVQRELALSVRGGGGDGPTA